MNRDEYRTAYAGTTRADLAFALEVAETPLEVDQAAHLSLCLFGVAGTLHAFEQQNRTWPSLQVLTTLARHRVNGFHGNTFERVNEVLDAGVEIAKARRRRDFQEAQAARDRQRA